MRNASGRRVLPSSRAGAETLRSRADHDKARGGAPRATVQGRLTASAIARTWSGVDPQQPPTMRAPAAT